MSTLPHHDQIDNPHFVYEFVDPLFDSNDPSAVFYVGITIDLYGRYRQHMHCDGTNVQKDQRIQSILEAGHLPIMRTREKVGSFAQALERESYWIQFYLGQGVALTNIAGVPVPGAKSNPVKKLLQFTIDDLDRITFLFNGVEHNAATVDSDIFQDKASQHANLGNSIGWGSLRQRSYFLSKLWTYCRENGYRFPYNVASERTL